MDDRITRGKKNLIYTHSDLTSQVADLSARLESLSVKYRDEWKCYKSTLKKTSDTDMEKHAKVIESLKLDCSKAQSAATTANTKFCIAHQELDKLSKISPIRMTGFRLNTKRERDSWT